MEKDIGKIEKNDTTDVVVRIDDFGGRVGLTIREFITSDRYTGFTKSGVRISADDFSKFKEMINSVDEQELKKISEELKESQQEKTEDKEVSKDQETLDKTMDESESENEEEKSESEEQDKEKFPDY